MLLDLINFKTLFIYLSSSLGLYYILSFLKINNFFQINILAWYLIFTFIIGFLGPNNEFLERATDINIYILTFIKGTLFGIFLAFFKKGGK